MPIHSPDAGEYSVDVGSAPNPGGAGAPRPERIVLTGDVPNPAAKPTGCAFHTRCPYAQQRCAEERPPLTMNASGRQAACHYPLTG